MIVEDPSFHVRKKGTGTYGIDKFKGMLHDTAVKNGLKLPNKYRKNAVVKMTEILEPAPISFNQVEDKLTKTEREAQLRMNKVFTKESCTGGKDFDTLLKSAKQKEFVYRPRRFDAYTKVLG